jgi:hypothetical protein
MLAWEREWPVGGRLELRRNTRSIFDRFSVCFDFVFVAVFLVCLFVAFALPAWRRLNGGGLLLSLSPHPSPGAGLSGFFLWGGGCLLPLRCDATFGPRFGCGLPTGPRYMTLLYGRARGGLGSGVLEWEVRLPRQVSFPFAGFLQWYAFLRDGK